MVSYSDHYHRIWTDMTKGMTNLPKEYLECIRALGAPDDKIAPLKSEISAAVLQKVQPEIQQLLDLFVPI